MDLIIAGLAVFVAASVFFLIRDGLRLRRAHGGGTSNLVQDFYERGCVHALPLSRCLTCSTEYLWRPPGTRTLEEKAREETA